MDLSLLPLTVFLLLLATFAGACPASERAALLAFKASMYDDTMGIFSTWTGSNCCSNWYGISCDPTNGRVADITLRGEAEHPPVFLPSAQAGKPGFMSGTISPEICKINRLTTLVLADWKNISGSIPSCISELPILRIIDVVGNRIDGELPEGIGKLKTMTVLNVADNLIDGRIPKSLTELSSLMHLDLSNNRLTGIIPSNFGNLRYSK